jgi:Protein of unknown function (DUF3592)
VRGRSAIDSAGIPAALLKPTPRPVRVNASGLVMLIVAAALVVAGGWGGSDLQKRADVAERHVGLFASERVLTGGDVVELRKRGGGNDHRVIAHYRYAVHGRELMGRATLRRGEREKYAVGSPVAVWYLASEPEASWLDGDSPRPERGWTGTVVAIACGLSAMALMAAVRRQSKLLAHGRPAMATVTKVEKKRTENGTVWRVHYEWTTMSGATRTGKHNHRRKNPPAVGELFPIVCDRDNTFRHSKYPMPFVRIADD